MFTRAEALKGFAAWGGALLVGGADIGHRRRKRSHMGQFLIPNSSGLNANFNTSALGSGQWETGYFYLVPNPVFPVGPYPLAIAPTSDGPNIFQRWRILAFYIPLFVSYGLHTTPPTNAYIKVSGFVNGEQRWAGSTTIPILQNDGNAIISDDLVNPFDLTVGQQLTFGYMISFDQAVNGYGLNLGYSLDIQSPVVSIPAPVRYEVDYDRRLPGRG